MVARGARRTGAWLLGIGALAVSPLPARATVLQTTNAGEVATFSQGMNVEDFDDGLTGEPLTSYDTGQTVDAESQFRSRDSATEPTFHSGGATPSNPVGNPGEPIGIIDPSGGIAGDVESAPNVAAPLRLEGGEPSTEPWNFGFMEVIFFPGNVERVGFWITHGSVRLDLRDRSGSNLTTGDVTVTGNAGEFIGISRDGTSDIAVVALSVQGGGDAFTIDDFTYADSVPEPAAALLLLVAAAALAARRS